MRNLAEMLRTRVRKTPDAEALVFGETRHSHSKISGTARWPYARR